MSFVLLGNHRSGSSYMLDVIRHHNCVETINEPFSMHLDFFRSDETCWLNKQDYRKQIPENSSTSEYINDLNEWLNDKEYNVVRGFKETALFEKYNWLIDIMEIHETIILIRDFRAIINSVVKRNMQNSWWDYRGRLKDFYGFSVNELDDIEVCAYLLKQRMNYIKKIMSSNQILLIRLEDYLKNKLRVAETIMNYINLDLSRITLASFIKKYGVLSEQDFVLFSAYFDEMKNHTSYFTKDEAEKYYAEARRTKPQNISMCLTQLAQKGFIIDAIDIEQKSPKPYRISSEGLEYIRTYVPKEVKERKPSNKPCKQRAKEKSMYADIDCDELNLSMYPSLKSLKDFKEKMMLILYIITNEGKGEWFTTTDVLCLMTDIFGESATKDQVNGVFKREKRWFKSEHVDGNNKLVRRKLLNEAKTFAQSLGIENVSE